VLGALGLEVNRLIRISYGPFQLGDLAEGKVLEVRGRMLRDQLGPRLIEEAGANFDAPIYNTSVDDEEEAPAKRAKPEWAKGDAPEGKPRFEKSAGRPEDRREKALGRLDTKRGDKPAGKFGSKPAGKFGAKGRNEDDGEERRSPRQPAGTSRTANVWMAPGAKPTRDGKERKSSARAEAESLFKKPSAQAEARRSVVRHADDEGEWIRSEPTREDDRGQGRGDRSARGEKSFGDRGGRGGKSFGDRPSGDRPFRDRPREDGDRPRGDRPARGAKSFGDRPFRDRPREDGDRPRSDRPRGEKSFGDRTARGEKPFSERPFRDRPREEGDRPRGDRPFGDKPRGGKPGGRPASGKPSFGKSGERGERSGFSGKGKGPGGNGPGGGKPGGKGPGGKPSGGRGMTRNADRRR